MRHVPLALALVLLASPAQGQDAAPPVKSFKWTPAPRWLVRLTFTTTTPGCASFNAPWLAERVAARLGYDPFDPRDVQDPIPEPGYVGPLVQAGHLDVKLTRTGESIAATAHWPDKPSGPKLPATYSVSGTDRYACFWALEKLATHLLWQFPLPTFDPPDACPAAPPNPAPTLIPACDDCHTVWPRERIPLDTAPPAAPATTPNPFALRVGASVEPEILTQGWAGLGLSAEASARLGWTSVAIKLHGDPPLWPVIFQGAGQVSLGRLAAGLDLCLHAGVFVGCVSGDGGAFTLNPATDKLPPRLRYTAVGASVGLEVVTPQRQLLFMLRGDLRAVFGDTYDLRGITGALWAPTGWGGGLGLGLLYELLPFKARGTN